MTDLRVLPAFLAVCALALFFASRGVKGALAPLTAVGAVALWLTFFGTLGLLWAGTLALYLLALGAAAWLLWRWLRRKKGLPNLGFGFWFFIGASLLVLALLWAKQPMLTDWDEFSTWGTAGKLTVLYDELYTTAPVGWPWVTSQTPVQMVLMYFFQFFGDGFVEWQTYAATDIFQLAAMAALTAPFEKKHWNLALPMALCGVLVPFAMVHYRVSTQTSPVLLTTLADIPMGLCFAAALAAWFGGERKRLWGMIPVCVALATLTLTKDIALMPALVAVVVIFADVLFERRDEKVRLRTRLGAAAKRGGLGLGAVVLAFVWWNNAYIGRVAGVERMADAGGKQGMGLLEMPFAYLKDLFSPGKSEFFTTVNGEMARRFLFSRDTLLGSGAMVAGIAILLLVAAAVLAKNPALRRRNIVFAVTSTLGFAAYYAVITMSYLYVMRPEQALELDSYNRYVYPYYIAWLLLAVMLLGQVAADGLGRYSRKRVKWRALLASGGVVAVAALLFLRVGANILPGHTLLGVDTELYNERRAFSAQVQAVRQKLDPAGKTFLVMSNDTGLLWFMYCHEMLPWQVDYSFGGGEMATRTHGEGGETVKHVLSADELRDYITESGCDMLYIDNADAAFFELYGSLFADGGAGYRDGGTRYYAVDTAGDGPLLAPAAL